MIIEIYLNLIQDGQKINRDLSFKISGSYLQGNEWEFVSEEEYKLHSYPYSGFKERAIDGKDNNPWNNEYDLLTTSLNSSRRSKNWKWRTLCNR